MYNSSTYSPSYTVAPLKSKKGHGHASKSKTTSSKKNNKVFFEIREKYHESPSGNDNYNDHHYHHNHPNPYHEHRTDVFDRWGSTLPSSKATSSSSYYSSSQVDLHDNSPTSVMDARSNDPFNPKKVSQEFKRHYQYFDNIDNSSKKSSKSNRRSSSANRVNKRNSSKTNHLNFKNDQVVNHFHSASSSISTSRHRLSSEFPKVSSSSSSTTTSTQKMIPGITNMTMRQSLAVIFSAFWERADLYKDVLEVDHEKPSQHQLRLAFFRQGRKALTTPVESLDDVTVINSGIIPMLAGTRCDTTYGNQQLSRMKVSRKAKMKFQAINLAYELLIDESKRRLYDEWRLWNTRLPPPSSILIAAVEMKKSSKNKHSSSPSSSVEDGSYVQTLTNHELTELINDGSDVNHVERLRRTNYDDSPPLNHNRKYQYDNATAIGQQSIRSKARLPSILREPKFGIMKDSTTKSIRNEGSKNHFEQKIKWNEEVEELVVLETDYINYESFHSSCDDINDIFTPKQGSKSKNNIYDQNMPDAYSNSTFQDDWFQNDTFNNNTNWSKNAVNQDFNFGLSDFHHSEHPPEPLSFNFTSLDDSQIIWTENATSVSTNTRKNKSPNVSVDDSFVAIMDGLSSSKQDSATKFTSRWFYPVQEKENAKNGNVRNLDHHGNKKSNTPLYPSQSVPKPTIEKRNVLSENTFEVNGGADSNHNVKINVRTYQKDSKTSSSQSTNNKVSEVKDFYPDIDHKSNVNGTGKLDVDEVSLQSKETFDSSWKSFGNIDQSFAQSNDCALFNSPNCISPTKDLFSIDLTKGFQATLSNYINAALGEMKKCYDTLGKKWEENVGENPVMINSFDLDSMMDILQTEMKSLQPVNNMSRGAHGDTT